MNARAFLFSALWGVSLMAVEVASWCAERCREKAGLDESLGAVWRDEFLEQYVDDVRVPR